MLQGELSWGSPGITQEPGQVPRRAIQDPRLPWLESPGLSQVTMGGLGTKKLVWAFQESKVNIPGQQKWNLEEVGDLPGQRADEMGPGKAVWRSRRLEDEPGEPPADTRREAGLRRGVGEPPRACLRSEARCGQPHVGRGAWGRAGGCHSHARLPAQPASCRRSCAPTRPSTLCPINLVKPVEGLGNGRAGQGWDGAGTPFLPLSHSSNFQHMFAALVTPRRSCLSLLPGEWGSEPAAHLLPPVLVSRFRE